MSDLRCPRCGNLAVDIGVPGDICTPSSCDAWVTTAIYDHANREWVPLDDLNELDTAASRREEQ